MDRKRPAAISPPVKSGRIDSFFTPSREQSSSEAKRPRESSETETPKSIKKPAAKRPKLDAAEEPKKFRKSTSGLSTGSGDSGVGAEGCQLLDVVWAKLDAHPYWPGLIVQSDEKGHVWDKTVARNRVIHVVFYSRPTTWAWVKAKFVEKFEGPPAKGSKFCAKGKEWEWAVGYASRAILLTKLEREEHLGLSDEDTAVAKENNKETAEESSEESAAEDDDEDESFKVKAMTSESDSENEIPTKQRRPTTSAVTPKLSDKGAKRQRSVAATSTPIHSTGAKAVVITPMGTGTPKSSADITMRARAALSSFVAPDDDSPAADETKWEHLTYEFLKGTNRKDVGGKPHSEPDSDKKTLLVPDKFLADCTAAMKQWWKIKAQHFDTILFFKMGKFYELYHQDAVVGFEQLNLKPMASGGGKHVAHCGFPESAFSRYSEQLVERGHKVARVEQTETPQMMEERNLKAKSKEKVVRREVCRITTAGTKTFSFLDGDSGSSQSAYLLAICEQGSSRGICFVDTATGQMQIGQFGDDEQNSCLRTLLAHYPPAEVLCEKGRISSATKNLLSSLLRPSQWQQLQPNSQFWSDKSTLMHLGGSEYFLPEKEEEAESKGLRGKDLYPAVLKSMLDDGDVLSLTAKSEFQLAVRSLGAVIWYLKECLIDHDVLSLKKMSMYSPLGIEPTTVDPVSKQEFAKHMIIDAVSIRNLDILRSSAGGPYTTEGTLYRCLDFCNTPFGKRLLHQWVCAPLCDPGAISARQDAVANLLEMTEFVKKSSEILKKIPDVERLLQKIHTLGSLNRNKNHPDSRAVFFDADVYNKRKITDFLNAIEGLKQSVRITKVFQQYEDDVVSTLILRCLSTKDQKTRVFPDIEEELDHYDKAFDHVKAKKDGVIIPERGVDSEFDNCSDELSKVVDSLAEYLEEMKKHFKSSAISYTGTGKNRYQLELPDSVVSKVTDDFMLQSQRKGFKRYRTPTIEKLLGELENLEHRKDDLLADIARKIFAKFAAGHKKFKLAIDCLSVFDVLLSFARYASSVTGSICRPEVVESDKPFIEIKNGVFPSMSKTFSNENFIPNDCAIGGADGKSVILLTGPNMGGKSTLMRQVSITVIMAQLGSFVPADSCRLSPVDRIFTRIGASDKLLAGQSTFYVELSECGTILRHATRHSLVISDELGRGTATHDGTAIATGVLHYIAERIQCRTIFSTHYHTLVDDFCTHPNISLGHMACMVENENEEDPTEETITFLYKLRPGDCPKSYGFHVAKLAGIRPEVIREAHRKSCEFAAKHAKLNQLVK